MNWKTRRYALTLLSVLSLGAVPSWAQTAPGGSASVDLDAEDEGLIILDPFTVTTEQEGYKAEDTLGGARTRTKLIDTPSSVSVITPKLLEDLGVTNSESLLKYTTATETGGLYGNFSGMTSRGAGVTAGAETGRLANPQSLNRARGIGALDNTRNYLLSSIPWDGYNISRVEIARGPNSFLFGVGAPSGISNVMTNNASYQDFGSVEGRYGSYGSTRAVLDLNKEIIPGELAVRFDFVNDHAKYEQKPAYNDSKRGYAAVIWEPKFLDSEFAHTKIQANFERGQVRSNNPRTLPPMDYVTGYLQDPRMSQTGYNLWTYAPSSALSGSTDPNASFYSSNGSFGNWNQWGSSPYFYWDGATGDLFEAGQPNYSSPNGYGEPVNRYHVHSVGYNTYAKNMNGLYRQQNGVDGGEFAGALGGSVTYFDQTLTDKNIFNFYKLLIDGDNKREWQDWETWNVNIVQTLFDRKLSLQGLVSNESYSRGQEGMLQHGPTLMLDLDEYLSLYPSWMPDLAQRNPHLGRPFVFGPYAGGSRQWTERENYQLTAAYDLDLEGMMSKDSWLSKLLGTHQFTGLLSRSEATDRDMGYKTAGIDPLYADTYGGAIRTADNQINWLAYVGPSLMGWNTGDATLNNLTTRLPAQNSFLPSMGMRVWSDEWIAGDSVDPTAPWTMPLPDGTTQVRTQADNPANYAGYTRVPASVITSATHMDQLRTSSNMKSHRIDSKAIMYQGHLWNDAIIPSIGYREDETLQRGTTAIQNDLDGDGSPDPVETGLYREVTRIDDDGISATTHSTSYGVAVHVPRLLNMKLPEGTDLSLYYFHGNNETPKVRYGIDGLQLPNESGETNDYSIQLDYKGKLTMRLTRFDTVSKYAQASYGSPLGGSGWFIGAAPNWALTMGAAALAAWEFPDSELHPDMVANNWISNWARDPARAELMPQIAKAFSEDFTAFYDQAYWDRYGANVDVAAIQRGDWRHILTNTDVVLPWTITGIGDSIHGVQEIIDQDVGSKGYELEVTFRPKRNWDITFNVAKVNATQIKLGDSASRWMEGMKHLFVDTAMGDVAMWGGYNDAGAWRSEFTKNLWAPYNIQVALTGSDQPEVREWRFNGITNYRFDEGRLKGLNIGGAFRWEDQPTLGFGIYNKDIGQGQSLWISDVNQRLQGEADEHFDLWVGYERQLTEAIKGRLQINVRNVGENTKLVPITLQPNGDVAQSRIMSGQSVDVSMKFMF